MDDSHCVEFLQWALPRLRLRWAGFRKVRRQVCKRIARRIAALGLGTTVAYRSYLEDHAEEWPILDDLCRVTISRFYRDRGVFDALRLEWLPALAATALARGERTLRVWSAGCASGEEPYTLAILWRLEAAARWPGLELRIVATEIDPRLIERARRGRYTPSSLLDLPSGWRRLAFRAEDGLLSLREEFRAGIEFGRQDIRETQPEGFFDLVLCRYLAFTYFDVALQRETAARIAARLYAGGLLVLGNRETLPPGTAGFAPCAPRACAYWRLGRAAEEAGP